MCLVCVPTGCWCVFGTTMIYCHHVRCHHSGSPCLVSRRWRTHHCLTCRLTRLAAPKCHLRLLFFSFFFFLHFPQLCLFQLNNLILAVLNSARGFEVGWSSKPTNRRVFYQISVSDLRKCNSEVRRIILHGKRRTGGGATNNGGKRANG